MHPRSTTSRNTNSDKCSTWTAFASPTMPLAPIYSDSLTNQHPRINEGPLFESLDDLQLVSDRLNQNQVDYRSQKCKSAAPSLKVTSATDHVTTMSTEDRHFISFLDKLEEEIDLSIVSCNQQDTNCLALEPNAIIPSKHDEAYAERTLQVMPKNNNATFYHFSEYCRPSTYAQMPPHTGNREDDRFTLQDWTSKAKHLKEQKHFTRKVDSMRSETVRENEKQIAGSQTMKRKDCHSHRNLTANRTAKDSTFPSHKHDSTSSSSLSDHFASKPEVLKKDSVKTLQTAKISRPIHALNAYNFFFIDERDRILSGRSHDECDEIKKELLLLQHLTKDRSKRRQHRKSHGKIDFIGLSRTIGRRWRNLPEAQKKFYRDVASSDFERYHKELNSTRLIAKAIVPGR